MPALRWFKGKDVDQWRCLFSWFEKDVVNYGVRKRECWRSGRGVRVSFGHFLVKHALAFDFVPNKSLWNADVCHIIYCLWSINNFIKPQFLRPQFSPVCLLCEPYYKHWRESQDQVYMASNQKIVCSYEWFYCLCHLSRFVSQNPFIHLPLPNPSGSKEFPHQLSPVIVPSGNVFL